MRGLSLLAAMLLVGACVDADDDPSVATDGEALSGTNLGGTNLSGTNLSGTNLSGTNLAGGNLGGANLSGTNLSGTNLSGTNLGGNNLGGANLSGTNLSGTNLSGTNLSGTNLSGTNLSGSNLSGSNLAGANLAGNNLAGTNLVGNLSAPGIGKNIHALGGGATGMLLSGEDVWDPSHTKSCVVMGIGSTALAKLLGQQSANAHIYEAINKTSWGFSATPGGQMQLTAWEALIWGDHTYCEFIIAAPTTATFAGIAGFTKAVFRWAAPPTQSIDIGQIGGGQPIATYTGMMDAGSQFRGGNLLDRDYVAGELALITATTNNQVVFVDFASWARDRNKNAMVLGNVSTTSSMSFGESVFMTLDNGDGTVQVVVADPFILSGPPAGMHDAAEDLAEQYQLWMAGKRTTKPIPKRCAGALALNAYFGEPIPAGKCDAGLNWSFAGCLSGSQPWSTIAGTSAPYNTYMLLTQPGGTFSFSNDGTCKVKPVLAATYVHLNDQAW